MAKAELVKKLKKQGYWPIYETKVAEVIGEQAILPWPGAKEKWAKREQIALALDQIAIANPTERNLQSACMFHLICAAAKQ